MKPAQLSKKFGIGVEEVYRLLKKAKKLSGEEVPADRNSDDGPSVLIGGGVALQQ